MDLQEYLNAAVKAQRADSFAKSDQLSLGEMILKMEPIVKRERELVVQGKEETRVYYDFCGIYPKTLDSWRGIYRELALSWEHNNWKEALTAGEFYLLLVDAVGKTFMGYKGGDFTMSRQTPVWVSNYGESSHTAVIDIVYNEGIEVLIITAYREA